MSARSSAAAAARGGSVGVYIGAALVALAAVGCDGSNGASPSPPSAARDYLRQADSSEALFSNAIRLLNEVEQFETRPMRDRRTGQRLAGSVRVNTVDALAQVVDRLNQWLVAQPPLDGWELDPLARELPEHLRGLPEFTGLAERHFSREDGWRLQEVVWLRDVARGAIGGRTDPRERAERLFAWVVRNIALEPSPPPAWVDGQPRMPREPWEVLLLGRGTAEERAWVFALLARQVELPVVILALPAASPPTAPATSAASPTPAPAVPTTVAPTASAPASAAPSAKTAYAPPAKPPTPEDQLAFWLPAAWIDGELYLFDTALGLPIPGPQRQGVATLKQVRADPALLAALDLDAEHRYPVRAEALGRVTALIEMSPVYLGERFALVEPRLPGERQMVLSLSTRQWGEALRTSGQVDAVRPWELPWERIRQKQAFDAWLEANHPEAATRPDWQRLDPHVLRKDTAEMAPFHRPDDRLWRARVLHVRGLYRGEANAVTAYQICRPSEQELNQLDEYLPAGDAEREAMAELLAMNRTLAREAKRDATFWLGLVAGDRSRAAGLPGGEGPAEAERQLRVALQYLDELTLRDPQAARVWGGAARFALAQLYEALGQPERAAALYAADVSPQRHGNLLRARWLSAAVAAPAAATAAPTASGVPTATPPAAGTSPPVPKQPAPSAAAASAPTAATGAASPAPTATAR